MERLERSGYVFVKREASRQSVPLMPISSAGPLPDSRRVTSNPWRQETKRSDAKIRSNTKMSPWLLLEVPQRRTRWREGVTTNLLAEVVSGGEAGPAGADDHHLLPAVGVRSGAGGGGGNLSSSAAVAVPWPRDGGQTASSREDSRTRGPHIARRSLPLASTALSVFVRTHWSLSLFVYGHRAHSSDRWRRPYHVER